MAFVLVALVAWLALGSSGWAATSDPPTPSVTVLGSNPGESTVTVHEQEGRGLLGRLALAVRSGVKGSAKLRVAYYPTGSVAPADAGSVAFAGGSAPTLDKKGRVESVELVFTLPPGSTPADLKGTVILRAKAEGGKSAPGAQVEVTGTAPSLAGIAVRPEKLNIKIVDEQGPVGDETSAYANVQLAGPGVPKLFQLGTAPPSLNLLLRSDHGDKARATLVDVTQSSDPTLATGTVRIEGDLAAGKFEGEAPISTFAADAPKLAITLESGDSVVYAVLAVFLGTVLGGGLYLASNRYRRKVLLRDQIKSVLDLYTKQLAGLEAQVKEGEELPIWTLADYLGEDGGWYEVEWDSIVNFDGAVRTAWSEIHWARDDGDLDRAAALVAELRAHVVRWLTVAKPVNALQEAAKLDPKPLPNEPWKSARARKDSAELLRWVRQQKPADDEAAAALVDRIERQARWHTELAKAWYAKAELTRDMDKADSGYGDNDRTALAALDLADLDASGSPESARTAERQTALENELASAMDAIRSTYRGEDKSKLDLPGATAGPRGAAPADLVRLTAAPTGESTDGGLLAPELTEATRAAPRDTAATIATKVRGSSASDHTGSRIPVAVRGVLKRDLAWTIAIALASSAVYILAGVYTPSWGTAIDYISAFAAGFIGKAAISWAALPLFQSIRGGAASAVPAAAAPAPAAGVAPTAAPPPAGAPAPSPTPAAPAPAAPPAAGGDGAAVRA